MRDGMDDGCSEGAPEGHSMVVAAVATMEVW